MSGAGRGLRAGPSRGVFRAAGLALVPLPSQNECAVSSWTPKLIPSRASYPLCGDFVGTVPRRELFSQVSPSPSPRNKRSRTHVTVTRPGAVLASHASPPRQSYWAHCQPPPAPPEWPRHPRAWPFWHHQIQCPAVVGCKGLAPGPSQPKPVGPFFLAAPGGFPRLSQLHHSSASAFTHPSLPPRPLGCQPLSTY